MRKVGLAAMAALLVLGTAQALTIDWEEQVPEGAWVSESLSGPHNNTYYKNGVETSSGSFILRVTFPATLTAKEVAEAAGTWVSAANVYFWENRSGGEAVSYGVGYALAEDSERGLQKGWYAYGKDGAVIQPTTPVLGLEDALNADGSLTTLFYYDEAANTLSIAVGDTLLGVFQDVYYGTSCNVTCGAEQGGTANRLDTVFAGVEKPTVEIAVIPEPTALALLALGVAGVALRRRVG